METFVISCTAGCGRTRTVNLPTGESYSGPAYLCAIDQQPVLDAERETLDQTVRESEQAAFDIKVADSIQRIMNQPDVYVFVDDNPADLTPGIWTKLKNLFRGGSS